MFKVSIMAPMLGLLATPAFAEPVTFSRGGIDYVATDGVIAGKRVIEGHEVATGRAFRLVVSGDHVAGTYAGAPISFRVPARRNSVEVASR